MDNISTVDSSIFFNTAGRSKQPLQVFIGGRGVGKTFSTLRNNVWDESKEEVIIPQSQYSGKFMYVRNTQKQIDLCGKAAGNPYKKINAKLGISITPRKDGDMCLFYADDVSGVKRASKITSPLLGYGVALSTFGNMRGGDFSDVDSMVFDEFIDPSARIRALMKTAGVDFQNLRETVARNREIEGQEPLAIKLLSNSITLDSPILLELGIANTIAHMIMVNQHRCTIPEKGIYIELVENKEFEELKKETTLYKASKEDTLFVQQALKNQFFGDNFDLIRKNAPVNEYTPKFTVNKAFTLYRHKSRNEWFCSAKSIQKNCPTYTSSDMDRLIDDWSFLYKRWILSRKIFFDNYATKLLADSLMKQ